MNNPKTILRNLQGKTLFKISIIALLASLVSVHFISLEMNQNSIKAAQRILIATSQEIEIKMKKTEVEGNLIKNEFEKAKPLHGPNLASLKDYLESSGEVMIGNFPKHDQAMHFAQILVAGNKPPIASEMEVLDRIWLLVNRYGNAWIDRYSRIWVNIGGKSKIEFRGESSMPHETAKSIQEQWHNLVALPASSQAGWSNLFYSEQTSSWVRSYHLPLIVNGKVKAYLGIDFPFGDNFSSKISGENEESMWIGDLGGEQLSKLQTKELKAHESEVSNGFSKLLEEIKSSRKEASVFYDRESKSYLHWVKSIGSRNILVIKSASNRVEDSYFSLSILAIILLINGISFGLQSLVIFYSLRQEIVAPLLDVLKLAQLYLDNDVIPQIGSSSVDTKLDEIDALELSLKMNGTLLNERRSLLNQLNNAANSKNRLVVGKNQLQFEDDRAQISRAIQLHNNLSVGDLAGGVAHEINNPLAVLNGHANLLKRILAGELKRQELIPGLIEKMELAIKRMKRILDGLVMYSNSAKVEKAEVVSLEDSLMRVQRRLQGILSEKEINFRIHCSADFKVKGQLEQLGQAFQCLIENSIDAVTNLEFKWILVDVRIQKNWYEIKITDSGAGIPNGTVEKMMNPFFTTKEVGQGTGLGLCIAQGIFENFGGSIAYVKNAPNTTFEVKLPRFGDTT